MSEAELKPLPCPGCDSPGEVLNAGFRPRAGYKVHCTNCGWVGPQGKTPEEAVDKWNTRPAATPSKPSEDAKRVMELLRQIEHGETHCNLKDDSPGCDSLAREARYILGEQPNMPSGGAGRLTRLTDEELAGDFVDSPVYLKAHIRACYAEIDRLKAGKSEDAGRPEFEPAPDLYDGWPEVDEVGKPGKAKRYEARGNGIAGDFRAVALTEHENGPVVLYTDYRALQAYALGLEERLMMANESCGILTQMVETREKEADGLRAQLTALSASCGMEKVREIAEKAWREGFNSGRHEGEDGYFRLDEASIPVGHILALLPSSPDSGQGGGK